jgi:hypothetical protein
MHTHVCHRVAHQGADNPEIPNKADLRAKWLCLVQAQERNTWTFQMSLESKRERTTSIASIQNIETMENKNHRKFETTDNKTRNSGKSRKFQKIQENPENQKFRKKPETPEIPESCLKPVL